MVQATPIGAPSDDGATTKRVLEAVRRFAAPAVLALEPGVGGAPGALSEGEAEGDEFGVNWQVEGLLFARPPGGAALVRWAEKICEEAAAGTEIVTLTPSATGAPWCRRLLTESDAHLFWKEELAGAEARPFDEVSCYFGPQTRRFRRLFDELGLVYLHPNRKRPRTAWCYELHLVLGDGRRRWQRSEPMSYGRARGELLRWRSRGHSVRLVEAP